MTKACGLAHAGSGKGTLGRMENDRLSRMVSLRDCRQPAQNRRLPDYPEDALLDSLDALGIPPS